MKIVRQRLYSEEEKDDVRLSRRDEKAIEKYKKNPKLAKLHEDAYAGDENAKKALAKKAGRRAAWGNTAFGAVEGGLLGAAGGALAGNDENWKKTALIGAGVGAAAGAGLGRLTIGASSKKNEKRAWMNADKKSRSAEREVDKQLDKDRLAVASGKMSKKKFYDKWGL